MQIVFHLHERHNVECDAHKHGEKVPDHVEYDQTSNGRARRRDLRLSHVVECGLLADSTAVFVKVVVAWRRQENEHEKRVDEITGEEEGEAVLFGRYGEITSEHMAEDFHALEQHRDLHYARIVEQKRAQRQVEALIHGTSVRAHAEYKLGREAKAVGHTEQHVYEIGHAEHAVVVEYGRVELLVRGEDVCAYRAENGA